MSKTALTAFLTLALLTAGCTDAPSDGGLPGSDGQAGTSQLADGETDCSEATREANKPDGQPYGTLDHYLTNGYDRAITVVVEHLDESGCALGFKTAVLDPNVTLTIEYEDHLWGAAERIVTIDDEEAQYRFENVDWACSWDRLATPDGLENREEFQVCA